MKGNESPLAGYIEHSARAEEKKQAFLRDMAGKGHSGKRQVVGKMAEGVAWTRQEQAWNGRHCLDVFLWATVSSQLPEQQCEKIKGCY